MLSSQLLAQRVHTALTRPLPLRSRPRRMGMRRAAAGVEAPDASTEAGAVQKGIDMTAVKERRAALVQLLASLDRGLAASNTQAKKVEEMVAEIVDLAGPPTLESEENPELQGTWRLLYTSGFNTGSLGGSRPGPPAGLVPAALGQVLQRIDAPSRKLDNIVEFLFPPPPLLKDLLRLEEQPALRLTLGHDYRVIPPTTVEITYEDTSAEIVGGPSFLPKFSPPKPPEFLRSSSQGLRSATFEVLHLDTAFRITRGDRGELRIYTKDV